MDETYTVKPLEMTPDGSSSKPLPPFRLTAPDCDRAADKAREWARGEVRAVRSISHGDGNVIHLMVYPQKR